MEMTEGVKAAIALLQQVGFPVFVASWFMWRMEKKLDRMADDIEELIKEARK